ARLEQARAQASVVSANLFPQVGLQAGATRAKTSADRPLAAYGSVNQSTVQDSYQFGFAASYELDMFGRIQRSIESAKASAEQAAS
ncbi:TolC family protein, partial [Enterococcus faecalis]|uniref:TolC family protein n=1 Tax=Enterococcus faecalis TaxID=1351 RepID=UPI003D6BD3A6